jgi:hypothetical protein
VAALLLPLHLATSCDWRPMSRGFQSRSEVARVAELTAKRGFLKAHLQDGGVLLFNEWSVDEPARRVVGQGFRFDAGRQLQSEGALAASLDSVVLFETNVAPHRLHPAVQALLIVVGVSLAVVAAAALALAACGKSCTGSCPTFYVWDGARYVLAAEGFSASVAPCLEATDLDAIPSGHVRDSEVEVVMLNEALETHVVRSVRLLVVPRAGSARVLKTAAGTFWRAGCLEPPRRALAAEGDCTAKLRALDGEERYSRADSTDLAARETIELEFDPPVVGRVGLAIGCRQSLVTTYLFYQTLAWMGRSTGDWIAALETSGPGVRSRVEGVGRELGGIRVEVLDPRRGWIDGGEVNETGPIATDVHLLELPQVAGGVKRARMRMARGAWRLDWVALAALTRQVEPVALDPVRVLRAGAPDDTARRALLPLGEALTTLPGDRYTLVFRLPPETGDLDLFLESRGYYLEWVRDEWLAEEDPGRVAALFMNPRGMLRTMAPAFKRQEAEQEAKFWEVTRGHL